MSAKETPSESGPASESSKGSSNTMSYTNDNTPKDSQPTVETKPEAQKPGSHPISVTVFAHYNVGGAIVYQEVPFEKWGAVLQRPPKEGTPIKIGKRHEFHVTCKDNLPLWSAVSFGPGDDPTRGTKHDHYRSSKTVQQATAVVLDLDNKVTESGLRKWEQRQEAGSPRPKLGTGKLLKEHIETPEKTQDAEWRLDPVNSIDQILAAIEGLDLVWHSSYSASEEHPKYRVMIRVSRPMNRTDYQAVMTALSEELACHGVLSDDCGDKPEQAWYFPYAVEGFKSGVVSGEPLDVDAYIARAKTVPQIETAPKKGRKNNQMPKELKSFYAACSDLDIKDVLDWLGLHEGQHYKCPGCKRVGNHIRTIPGANLLQCYTGSCGRKIWNPITLVQSQHPELSDDESGSAYYKAAAVLGEHYDISVPPYRVVRTETRRRRRAPTEEELRAKGFEPVDLSCRITEVGDTGGKTADRNVRILAAIRDKNVAAALYIGSIGDEGFLDTVIAEIQAAKCGRVSKKVLESAIAKVSKDLYFSEEYEAEVRPGKAELALREKDITLEDGQLPEKDDNGKPIISISTDIKITNDIAIKALANASGYNVYQRNGKLVRLQFEGSDYIVNNWDLPGLQETLSTIARFVTETKEGLVPTLPPKLYAEAILSRHEWPGVPLLRGFVYSPCLRPDGTVLTDPGYDKASGLFLVGEQGFPLSIPDNPTLDDAKAALEVLKEPFVDFCFEQEGEDLAGILSLVLSAVSRHYFTGANKMVVIGANTPGSGKDLLTDVAQIIATGRWPASQAGSKDAAEVQKRILSTLLAAPPVARISDVSVIGGSVWAALLTAWPYYEDRVLGQSHMARVINNTIYTVNGNNIEVLGDLARRVVVVYLRSPMARPQERTDFKIGPADVLRAYVKEHQGRFLGAALTILRAFIVAGAPKLAHDSSYDGWASLVASALVWVGMPDVSKGQARLAQKQDTDDGLVGAFCSLIQEVKGETIWTAQDLSDAMLVRDKDMESASEETSKLREAAALLPGVSRNSKDIAQSVGYSLKRIANRIGDNGLVLQRTQNTHTKAWNYRVMVSRGTVIRASDAQNEGGQIEDKAEGVAGASGAFDTVDSDSIGPKPFAEVNFVSLTPTFCTSAKNDPPIGGDSGMPKPPEAPASARPEHSAVVAGASGGLTAQEAAGKETVRERIARQRAAMKGKVVQ